MRTAPIWTLFVHEFVTGGGQADQDLTASWAAEGSAMRLAVAAEFATVENVRVVMTLDHRLSAEPGPWRVVRVGPNQEEAVFNQLVAECDATILIAPESAGILLERARRIELLGRRSLGSTPGAIALCGDKLLLSHFLSARGLQTPPSCIVQPGRGLPIDFPYPAVLKPIDGAGCLETFAIGRADQVPDAAKVASTALLQPYIPGLPISASFLIGTNGAAHLVGIGRQYVETVAGQFRYLGGAAPIRPEPVVVELAQTVVSAVTGLRGWVGVDLIWDPVEERTTVIEVNPRVTTSFVGFHHVLPKGVIGRSWLDALEDKPSVVPDHLAACAQPGRAVRFSADGKFEPFEVAS